MKTYTKGNVIVEDIKVGDIHYEYDLGVGIKVEVIEPPAQNEYGYWAWKSKQVSTGRIIEYGITPGLAHYGPKLYDYEAYKVKIML